MNETWWVDLAELDEKQKEVIGLSLDGKYLIIGPPGSGKTNLLLLRANYLCRAKRPNVLILVFTRTLREFIASGANQYSFSVDKIQTYNSWASDLLWQHGIEIEKTNDFDANRKYLFSRLEHIVSNYQISGMYDCILLDEAHDLLPHEISLINQFSTNIFAVADGRQQIYRRDQVIDYIKSFVDESIALETHYRNGIMICRLADNIMRGKGIYQLMEPSSSYDEKSRPSRVQHYRFPDITMQCEKIISDIETQLQAYPGELIGIITPRHYELNLIKDILIQSNISNKCIFQDSESGYVPFDPECPICVSTLHSAKGLEFRALHFAACEALRKFPTNRNMAFTGVTRAKTSLSLYYSGNLLPYLEGSIAALVPLTGIPNIAEAFGQEE